jgi:hypothetical protein
VAVGFSNNKTGLAVTFKTHCDKNIIQIYKMIASNISKSESKFVNFISSNATCGDEMKLKHDDFGAFIMVMGTAVGGEFSYEIEEIGGSQKHDGGGSKIWIILAIIAGVLVIAGVAIHFIRARKLRHELGSQNESLV